MEVTIKLTEKEVAGLRHWFRVSADFGDVKQETGADLIESISKLAKLVDAKLVIDELVGTLHED